MCLLSSRLSERGERTLLIFAQIFADLSRVFAVFRVRDERGGESEDRIEIINNKISCSLLP